MGTSTRTVKPTDPKSIPRANDSKLYGASPVKRKRRTKVQIKQLDSQIVEVLQHDHPQSSRHLFYRMTDPRLPEPVEKSDRGDRAVQRRLVAMRRSGKVPYSWVTDLSRQAYYVNTYKNAGDFLQSVAGLYRADLWQDADYYVEVWCESRSIASVIRGLCVELAVDLYPAGGFSSISFAYLAAGDINDNHNGRKVVVLYIGDYDPAGVLIDVSLERELRLHLDKGIHLEFRRLAITPEQIREYDLPGKPRKKGDRRAPHVQETVEAEAMPAHILRDLLRGKVEALLPPRALEVARVAEENERTNLRRMSYSLGHEDEEAREQRTRKYKPTRLHPHDDEEE